MNAVPQQGKPQLSPEGELCAVALQFLTRTDLKGGEVDAYAKAFNFLNEFVEGRISAIPTEALAEIQTELQKYKDEFGDLPEVIEEKDIPAVDTETPEGELDAVE